MLKPALICDLEAFARRAQKLLQETSHTETCPADGIRHTLLVGSRIAARISNARAPLCTLHADLLCCILLKLTLVDRIAFSRTCHALRVLSLELGHLWTSQSLNLANPDRVRLFAAGGQNWKRDLRARHAALLAAQLLLLQRASPAPIRLDLEVDMSPHLLRLLEACMHRIEVLNLQLFDWRVSDYEPPLDHPEDVLAAFIDPAGFDSYTGNKFPEPLSPYIRSMTLLNRALSSPAPRLKAISLSMPRQMLGLVVPVVELRRDIFAGIASSTLLYIALHGLAFPVGGCPAFSQLTVFNWNPPQSIQDSDLDNILRSMPLLRTFGLTVTPFFGHDAARSPPAHGHLRHVAICLDGFWLGHALPAIDALLGYFLPSSHATDFIFRANYMGCDDPEHGDQENLRYPDGIEITMSWLVLTIGHRTLRLHESVSPDLLRRAETFARLSWCAVDAQFATASLPYPPASVLTSLPYPRAPVLTSLCVVLHSCSACYDGYFGAALGSLTLQPWECPALETFHFVRAPETTPSEAAALHGKRCAAACILGAQEVCDFVRERLIIPSSRLRRLSFTGFRLHPETDIQLGMLALRAVSETVHFDAEFPTNLCGHRIPPSMSYRDDLTALFEPPIWTPDPRDTLLTPQDAPLIPRDW